MNAGLFFSIFLIYLVPYETRDLEICCVCTCRKKIAARSNVCLNVMSFKLNKEQHNAGTSHRCLYFIF